MDATVSKPTSLLILVGAGHAHVEVLRSFAMQRPADTATTLISPDSFATYSGMVPGYLGGQYRLREAQIDARALAARAGARFLRTRVSGIDSANKLLHLESYPDQPYDFVSFDIGSTPAYRDRIRDERDTVFVKPIEIAARDLAAALDRPPPSGGRAAVVVGAGAGGVEIAFAIAARLRDESGSSVTVCDKAERPGLERGNRTARAVERAFAHHGIRFVGGVEVDAVDAGAVRFHDGTTIGADLVVWATGTAAAPIIAASGLATDERGFLAVDDYLRSTRDAAVFGAGDCVTLDSHPHLAKAGVYAVRQGPILAENLRAALGGRRGRPFRPQRTFLSLLNTGDGKAIASYRGWALRSRLAAWLKDRIDRRFIARYTRPALAPPDSSMGAMQPCGGCAAKVGADILERVLARLDVQRAPHVRLGVQEADDAAVFHSPARVASDLACVVTADMFPPFSDDLYLVGQVAAVNAASDLYAMGAEAAAAVAMVAVADEDSRRQETALEELLRGALAALHSMEIPLVGGHTIASPAPLIGFSMHGFAAPDRLLEKRGAAAGDTVILSKPLGTGVLLAAARAGCADSDWVESCHDSMLRSNGPMMRLLLAHGARACTDITGFGLAGHLGDLARRSRVTAEVDLDAVPALPGARELLECGWRSSFHAANERAAPQPSDGRNPLLIDPQTSGGLLATLPTEKLAAFMRACADADEAVWVIGRIVHQSGEPIRVVGMGNGE